MESSTYKHLVVGDKGEVGSALFRVLHETFGENVRGIDKEPWLEEPSREFYFVHICLPYSGEFDSLVKQYESWKYPGGVTVIHSTVPVGTTRRLGAVHSPIHGIHPNLEAGVRTFVKFIGACDDRSAILVAEAYRKAGIKGYIVKNPETSELSKLGCTTRHGLMIIEQKEFKRQCEKVGADFEEAYTLWNGLYSMGYRELGLPYLQRVIVKAMEGKIGGHCIVSNAKLINNPVGDFVRERNETF